MRRLLFFVLFLCGLSVGLLVTHAGRYRDVYRSICDLVEDHYYKADVKLDWWVRTCRNHAAHVRLFENESQLLGSIQDHMNELQVSHFQIYDPNEDKRLWKGESIDTGIRSRYVEDYLVVYKVEPKSAAEEAGIKAGDHILGIEGAEQVTPWGAMRRSGKFTVKRQGKPLELQVAARTFTVDSSPSLHEISKSAAILELDSFRSEFFKAEEWREMAARLNRYSHIIIDVRENAGGNFVAMLRALSTFHCEGRYVGSLLQPRKILPDRESFDDDTSDAHQIKLLEQYRSLGLRTFKGYGCYKGKVTVLVSSDTSSVAEIFANSFFYRKNSRVWGQPTAGDVVLAVWYDLPALGAGYSASIPEAVYMTPEKEELENRGVFPQKELYYDLNLSLAGKDSWVEEALR